MASGTNRGIVTVLGLDQIGITAWVSQRLADYRINILDISQTIVDHYFTMIMVVDFTASDAELADIAKALADEGSQRGLQIKVQHEDVFRYMHRI